MQNTCCRVPSVLNSSYHLWVGAQLCFLMLYDICIYRHNKCIFIWSACEISFMGVCLFSSLNFSPAVCSFQMTACHLRVQLSPEIFLGLSEVGIMGRPVCLELLFFACPKSRLWVLATNTWSPYKRFPLLCKGQFLKKVEYFTLKKYYML